LIGYQSYRLADGYIYTSLTGLLGKLINLVDASHFYSFIRSSLKADNVVVAVHRWPVAGLSQ